RPYAILEQLLILTHIHAEIFGTKGLQVFLGNIGFGRRFNIGLFLAKVAWYRMFHGEFIVTIFYILIGSGSIFLHGRRISAIGLVLYLEVFGTEATREVFDIETDTLRVHAVHDIFSRRILAR